MDEAERVKSEEGRGKREEGRGKNGVLLGMLGT